MWISKQISNACKFIKNTKIGKITSTQNADSITVQSDQEYRDLNNAAPFGIISIPPIGSKAVVTSTDQGFVYTGIINQKADLAPGELMLYSSGGANIILKNNGKVLINGVDSDLR